jgi:hypothetical protein
MQAELLQNIPLSVIAPNPPALHTSLYIKRRLEVNLSARKIALTLWTQGGFCIERRQNKIHIDRSRGHLCSLWISNLMSLPSFVLLGGNPGAFALLAVLDSQILA